MDPGDQGGLIEALEACGVLTDGQTARLSPLAGGVSSDVFRLDTSDGRTLVVKRSIPRLRVAAEWLAPVRRAAGEVRWLRLVRTLDTRLAPEVIAEIPEAFIFVMAWLDPATHPVWKEAMAGGLVAPAFAADVGRDLARIHAFTAGRADIAVEFDTADCFFALRISPFLLYTAERHPDVATRLRELAEALGRRKIALMHGDVSPKNILMGPAGPVFLDAECVAYGDPAFDLAFCLTHLLLKTVWLAPHARDLMESLRRLVAAYRAGAGWEPWESLGRRTAELVAALLLARIDGKSPAPYLTDPADKDFVRRAAKRLLRTPDLTLETMAQTWAKARGL